MDKILIEQYQKQMTKNLDKLALLADFDESTKFIEIKDGKEIYLDKYEEVRKIAKEIIEELEEIELFFFEELLSEVNWSDGKKDKKKSLHSTLQGEHRRWTKH